MVTERCTWITSDGTMTWELVRMAVDQRCQGVHGDAGLLHGGVVVR